MSNVNKPKNLNDLIRINKKLNRHLPLDGPEEMIILKGHLLLEEMLREILAKSVILQNAVDAAQLTFYQVVCIVQAMHTNKENEWVWLGIVAVNQVRNRMAHNLESPSVDERCASLIEHCREFGAGNVHLCEESGYPELAMAISDLYYALWEILKKVNHS